MTHGRSRAIDHVDREARAYLDASGRRRYPATQHLACFPLDPRDHDDTPIDRVLIGIDRFMPARGMTLSVLTAGGTHHPTGYGRRCCCSRQSTASGNASRECAAFIAVVQRISRGALDRAIRCCQWRSVGWRGTSNSFSRSQAMLPARSVSCSSTSRRALIRDSWRA